MSAISSLAQLVFVPLFAVVSLAIGLAKLRNPPRWFFALALIAPLGTVAYATWGVAFRDDRSLVYGAVIVWMLAAAGALALAMIGASRGWRASRPLVVLGTVMPLVTLLPLLLVVALGTGGSLD